MTDISLLYDRSETDEQGIRHVAEEIGISLGFLPFHKVAVGVKNQSFIYRSQGRDFNDSLEGTKVILNRTQAKNRRALSTSIFESLGKQVLNPGNVEETCRSKIHTLIKFHEIGVNVPDTIHFPSNVKEPRGNGLFQINTAFLVNMILELLGDNVVVKPDEGTHGVGIVHAVDEETLYDTLNSFEPSLVNPAGVLAQEYVNKWFFDLRIIIEKRHHGQVFCHKTAMARGGFKDFRTNTYLGNMVFRVNLPSDVMEKAVLCGEAIGQSSKSYVIALDAMPRFKEPLSVIREQLDPSFKSLESYFNKVLEAKKRSKKPFKKYTDSVEKAYEDYMDSDPYLEIQGFISEALKLNSQSVLFHEANACPDFWEQTRIVGGVNIAESLLRCAQSLL